MPQSITGAAEHKAVLNTLQHWADAGRIRLTVLKPDAHGRISAESLAASLEDSTVFVSIQHVNNELGVINPVEALAQLCRQRHVFFHVDAAQSLGKAPVDVSAWGADLVSFSGHKAYGPKGVGVLVCGSRTRGFLTPLMHGGSHERGVRPGTVALHQVVGLAEAFSIAATSYSVERTRFQGLRAMFLARLQSLSDWVLHSGEAEVVPSILSLGFRGVEGESLLIALKDIAVSSGSACNSVTLDPSHVLLACGIERTLAASTIRLSFGRFTDEAQMLAAADHIVAVVGKLRGEEGGADVGRT
ncbi:MAG: cysteine desulfurase family protein [Gammaproteobacteria bacterium]